MPDDARTRSSGQLDAGLLTALARTERKGRILMVLRTEMIESALASSVAGLTGIPCRGGRAWHALLRRQSGLTCQLRDQRSFLTRTSGGKGATF
jgi:hypothetical protein